jgi:hypothetical protein
MLYQGGEREKIHTLEIGGHVQMEKSDPEAQKEVLVIGLHMVGKNEYGSFNLEALKFLMHFREPGSSLYSIFTHTHIIFFFFSYIFFFLSFFLFLIFSSFSFSSNFFYLLPFEL